MSHHTAGWNIWMSVKKKRESPLEPSLRLYSRDLPRLMLQWKSVLLSRTGIASCRRLRCLGDTKIARRARLRDLVDHQFQRCAGSARVEEDRLVDGPVLLFEVLVIGQDVDRVLVLLGVGVLQLDLNAAHLLVSALACHGKFKVVPLSHPAKLVDFVMVPRDQCAH